MLTFTATKSYPRKFIREKSAPDLIHVREARSSGFIIVVSFIKLKNYLSSIYFREFSLRTLRAILFNLLDGGPIEIGISKLILYFVTLLLMRHYWNLDHSLAIALQKTSVRSTPIIHFAGQKTIWRRAVLKLVSVTCSNHLRDADGNADFRESHNYQIYLLWLFGALHLTKNSRHDYSVADYGKANSRLKGQNATIAASPFTQKLVNLRWRAAQEGKEDAQIPRCATHVRSLCPFTFYVLLAIAIVVL